MSRNRNSKLDVVQIQFNWTRKHTRRWADEPSEKTTFNWRKKHTHADGPMSPAKETTLNWRKKTHTHADEPMGPASITFIIRSNFALTRSAANTKVMAEHSAPCAAHLGPSILEIHVPLDQVRANPELFGTLPKLSQMNGIMGIIVDRDHAYFEHAKHSEPDIQEIHVPLDRVRANPDVFGKLPKMAQMNGIMGIIVDGDHAYFDHGVPHGCSVRPTWRDQHDPNEEEEDLEDGEAEEEKDDLDTSADEEGLCHSDDWKCRNHGAFQGCGHWTPFDGTWCEQCGLLRRGATYFTGANIIGPMVARVHRGAAPRLLQRAESEAPSVPSDAETLGGRNKEPYNGSNIGLANADDECDDYMAAPHRKLTPWERRKVEEGKADAKDKVEEGKVEKGKDDAKDEVEEGNVEEGNDDEVDSDDGLAGFMQLLDSSGNVTGAIKGRFTRVNRIKEGTKMFIGADSLIFEADDPEEIEDEMKVKKGMKQMEKQKRGSDDEEESDWMEIRDDSEDSENNKAAVERADAAVEKSQEALTDATAMLNKVGFYRDPGEAKRLKKRHEKLEDGVPLEYNTIDENTRVQLMEDFGFDDCVFELLKDSYSYEARQRGSLVGSMKVSDKIKQWIGGVIEALTQATTFAVSKKDIPQLSKLAPTLSYYISQGLDHSIQHDKTKKLLLKKCFDELKDEPKQLTKKASYMMIQF